MSRSYVPTVCAHISYGSPPVKVVPCFLAPLCPFPPPPASQSIGGALCTLDVLQRSCSSVIDTVHCAMAHVGGMLLVHVHVLCPGSRPSPNSPNWPAAWFAAWPVYGGCGRTNSAGPTACRPAGRLPGQPSFPAYHPAGPKRASPSSQAPPATSQVPQVPRLQACVPQTCVPLHVVRERAIGPLCPHMAGPCRDPLPPPQGCVVVGRMHIS